MSLAAVQSAPPDLQDVNKSAGGVSTFTPENRLSLAGGNLEMLETQNEVFLFSKHTLMSAGRNKLQCKGLCYSRAVYSFITQETKQEKSKVSRGVLQKSFILKRPSKNVELIKV